MDKKGKYHVKIVNTETGGTIIDERVDCLIGVFNTGDGTHVVSKLHGNLDDAFRVVLSMEDTLERLKTAHPELAFLLAAKDVLGISMTTVDLTALKKIKSSGGAEPDVPAAE